MSSNHQKNKTNMTSITRKLHALLVRRELACCFAADVWGTLFFAVGVLFTREYWFLGKISVRSRRFFTWDHTVKSIVYHVVDGDGKELLTYPVYHAACVLGILLAVVVVFQLFSLLWSGSSKQKKIRKILQPINELALQADELNRMTFDEDKYQRIEEAITQIQPEENQVLSLGDSDLQGIEAAMNNLLLRMRDSYRQQARFVNDASHELRTPIAVIEGYANMLARWGREDEKVLDESIAAIRQESGHMKHLVEQLLFLARGDSGKTVLQLETLDLGAMMREIYEESVMVDEHHHYQFLDSGKPLQVQADAALLKQAVRILVDNAAKYTRNGDEIRLSYGRTEENQPYLLVQDTGIGMAEADVAHMFERFYRADDVRGREGTGLGLSIAKWIIDKHGGHFEVLSRTELGTRIQIVLKKEQ